MPRSKEKLTKKIEKLKRKLNKYNSRETPPKKRSKRDNSPCAPREPTPVLSPQDSIMDELYLSEDTPDVQTTTEHSDPLILPEVAVEEVALDSQLLEILGGEPNKKIYGPKIHKDIVSRWSHILSNGLDKEPKRELLEKYLTPENCPTVASPKLNPEVKAALTDQNAKRDRVLQTKQDQLGCTISAIGQALNHMVSEKTQDPLLFQMISDAGRLLCDIHHGESVTRRNFIGTSLNKETKDAIQNSKIDNLLFGADLTEALKASKAITKTAVDLRNKAARQPRNLNSKGPPALQPRRQFRPTLTPGGPRNYTQPKTTQAKTYQAAQPNQRNHPPRQQRPLLRR